MQRNLTRGIDPNGEYYVRIDEADEFELAVSIPHACANRLPRHLTFRRWHSDLLWTKGASHFGVLYLDWMTRDGADQLGGTAWRLFNTIVATASPSKRFPWRLAMYSDSELADMLPGASRSSITRARHKLADLGFVRLVICYGSYVYILQNPNSSSTMHFPVSSENPEVTPDPV